MFVCACALDRVDPLQQPIRLRVRITYTVNGTPVVLQEEVRLYAGLFAHLTRQGQQLPLGRPVTSGLSVD